MSTENEVKLLTKQRRAEEAAEGMTVQELFDLLNPPFLPAEEDEETRWNKVHEVLPWLLNMAWCFYEGTNNEGPEQPAIGIAAAILDPIGDEEAKAKDALDQMRSLASELLWEKTELTPSTRAQLEEIKELVGCPYMKKPAQSNGDAS